MKNQETIILSAEDIIEMIHEKYENVSDVKFIITEKRIRVSSSNENHCVSGHIFDGVAIDIKKT